MTHMMRYVHVRDALQGLSTTQKHGLALEVDEGVMKLSDSSPV